MITAPASPTAMPASPSRPGGRTFSSMERSAVVTGEVATRMAASPLPICGNGGEGEDQRNDVGDDAGDRRIAQHARHRPATSRTAWPRPARQGPRPRQITAAQSAGLMPACGGELAKRKIAAEGQPRHQQQRQRPVHRAVSRVSAVRPRGPCRLAASPWRHTAAAGRLEAVEALRQKPRHDPRQHVARPGGGQRGRRIDVDPRPAVRRGDHRVRPLQHHHRARQRRGLAAPASSFESPSSSQSLEKA